MAALIPTAKQYYALPSGLPNVGGKVYTYAAGTSTPLATFSDAAGLVPNTNPVILDARGEALIFWNGVYKVELRDAANALIWTVDQVVGGIAGLISVSSRTILATTTTTAGASVYLSEAGREGTFVWRSTNFAALFGASLATVDPNQIIYVAPSSDVTGASGAWVRTGWEELDARWSGAAFDWNGTTGTDDGTKITSLAALSKYLAGNVSTNGFYKAGPNVRLPAGKAAWMNGTILDVTHTWALLGAGKSGQQAIAYSSQLKWADGVDGIRVQRFDTSGSGTIDGATHFGGDGFVVDGVRLTGGYVATEGEYHGIHSKARCVIRNCYIDGWSGDGIYVHADTASGGADHGNANNGLIDTVTVVSCRDGLSITGGDANAWDIRSLDTTGNRRWGRFDTSFLSNTYTAGHAADNGLIIGQPPSVVSNGGNRYAVVVGAEATASVTAPAGTADTVNWLYLAAGGVNAPLNIPAWVSGMTLRASGAAYFGNANSDKVVIGFYTESGQGPIQGTYPTTLIGGTMGYQPRGTLVWDRNYQGIKAAVNIGAVNQTSGAHAIFSADASSPLGRLEFSDAVANVITHEWTGGDLAVTVLRSLAPTSYFYALLGEGTTNPVGKRHVDFMNGFGFAGLKRFPATATPAVARIVGDYDIHTAPTAILPEKWVTTAAGTPGTQLADYFYPRADPTTGIGYVTGAGGTVTQATSKATAPAALNKTCGEIVLNNAALAANTVVSFTFSNSSIAANDELRLWVKSGEATPGSYLVTTSGNGAGTRTVCIRNLTAGSLSEAVVVGFAVGKVVVA